jgi:hypothetical protein
MSHPRDLHPVTSAMQREGTSVSKTMWHVPSTRQAPPAFTCIEDLLQSRLHQWNPVAIHKHARAMLQSNAGGGGGGAAGKGDNKSGKPHRFTTRATLDGQSLQNRIADAAHDFDGAGNGPNPSVVTSSNTSNGTSIAADDTAATGAMGGREEEDMECDNHLPRT